MGQKNGEFVAAIAKGGIYQAKVFAQGVSHLTQKLTAGQVSMLIVHPLKVIEVKKQEGELVTETFRTIYLVREPREQMTSVVQAGAVVGDTEFLDALDSARVLDGDGGVIGQGP